jgi:predicted kinase
MNKICYILRGVPGSGKSTYIKNRFAPTSYAYCSADLYFINKETGKYEFDISKIGEAHKDCLKKFLDLIQNTKPNTIIVDNTNTRLIEVAPYAQLACLYDYTVKVITILCDPLTAATRNVHGVPLENIQRMAVVLNEETQRMPSWWEHEERIES